jgi:hypothetical protein
MTRGVHHNLATVLAAATIATLRGAYSFRQLGQTAAELTKDARRRIRASVSARREQKFAPNDAMIWRTLTANHRESARLDVSCRLASRREARREDHANQNAPRTLRTLLRDICAVASDATQSRNLEPVTEISQEGQVQDLRD